MCFHACACSSDTLHALGSQCGYVLCCRNMSNNNLTGGLSSTWGAPGVWPKLAVMDLSQNYDLGGILLTQWGMPGSLPALQVMHACMPCSTGLEACTTMLQMGRVHVNHTSLWGLLWHPACVALFIGQRKSFLRLAAALLQTLNLCNTGLTGQLPVLWGVNNSFPALQSLDISRNIISGAPPITLVRCTSPGIL